MLSETDSSTNGIDNYVHYPDADQIIRWMKCEDNLSLDEARKYNMKQLNSSMN